MSFAYFFWEWTIVAQQPYSFLLTLTLLAFVLAFYHRKGTYLVVWSFFAHMRLVVRKRFSEEWILVILFEVDFIHIRFLSWNLFFFFLFFWFVNFFFVFHGHSTTKIDLTFIIDDRVISNWSSFGMLIFLLILFEYSHNSGMVKLLWWDFRIACFNFIACDNRFRLAIYWIWSCCLLVWYVTGFGFTSLDRSSLFLLVTDCRIMVSGDISLLSILLQMSVIREIKVSLSFLILIILTFSWKIKIETIGSPFTLNGLFDGRSGGGCGGYRESIWLYLLIDFIGYNINLIENRFEIILLLITVMVCGKFSIKIVFYVFIC